MDYEQIRLNKFRKRVVFSILGFTYTDRLYYTGELFHVVVILEEKIKERYSVFSEWDYQNHWTPFKRRWELIKVL